MPPRGNPTIRIGNGCGFWGDNLDAPIALARLGCLDYLTLEYLAELTMSILALQKQRNPQMGYATDFLDVLERLCPILHEQPHLKIITNAGGMNPPACAARARNLLDRAGLTERRIAIVTGDDLLPNLDQLLSENGKLVDQLPSLANLDTGRPLADVRPRVVSANAYLGSPPIANALEQGAAVVITGRVADAALTVGPAAHAFGWAWDDWDRLSAASVAGHLLECGAQATGGLWCNWQETDLADVGYPVAEMDADGSFLLTKPEGTGGVVNRETVSEQMLYEVGDPAAYLTPDVTADFTSVTLTEMGRDRVRVTNARGRPAPASLKVSIAYRDGFMASGTLVIAGPGARAKARRCGEILLDRLRRVGIATCRSHIECLGSGDSLPGVLPETDAPEVVLRVAVHDQRRAVVERFTKEFAPLVTSGPPGVTGYTTGRPTVREVFAYWPALLPRELVTAKVQMVQ
jgi:Acyclic terpene utilisation family protein AtuA